MITQETQREVRRCVGCRAKLKAPGCLRCLNLGRRGLAQFEPVPIPESLSEKERERLERSMASLLPSRIANALEMAGIHTVHDLLHRTQAELLSLHRIGTDSIKQILRALERLGFDTSKAWQALNRKRKPR